jgi:hypothetical protein
MPFVFRDPAEFVTPVGQAINAEFLGDEERLVTKLAAARAILGSRHRRRDRYGQPAR